MKRLKSIYASFLEAGQSKELTQNKNKRVRLLNYYTLLGIHFSLILPIADALSGILTNYFVICYLFMFLCMCLVYWLNKTQKHTLACYIWFTNIIFTIFLFSNFLFPQAYNEYYYVFIPGLALTLFPKSKVPIFVFVLCFCLFLVPYYILCVYIDEVIDKLDVFPIFGIFICIYMLFNYFNNNNIEYEKKLEKAYDELEKRKKKELANLKLKSLKGQMNPHFVFNALNSVQNLVIKGETKETYKYLSKFSGLIRENLKLNDENYIDFNIQFSLLKKYLELEKLRFKEELEYELIDDVTMANVIIPSMVIQPFIDNTIDRLFHKKEGVKKIKIEFFNEAHLICIITDNGIYREGLKIDKTSMWLENVTEVLDLIKEILKLEITFNYEYSDNETICILKIPYVTNL